MLSRTEPLQHMILEYNRILTFLTSRYSNFLKTMIHVLFLIMVRNAHPTINHLNPIAV